MYPDMRIICAVSMTNSSFEHSNTMLWTYTKIKRYLLSVYRYIICDIIECCVSMFYWYIFHSLHTGRVQLLTNNCLSHIKQISSNASLYIICLSESIEHKILTILFWSGWLFLIKQIVMIYSKLLINIHDGKYLFFLLYCCCYIIASVNKQSTEFS